MNIPWSKIKLLTGYSDTQTWRLILFIAYALLILTGHYFSGNKNLLLQWLRLAGDIPGYFLWFSFFSLLGWILLYFPYHSILSREILHLTSACLILSFRFFTGSFAKYFFPQYINRGITDNILEGGTLILCIYLLSYSKVFPFKIAAWFKFPQNYRIYLLLLLIIPLILIPVSSWNDFSGQYPKWRFNHIPQTNLPEIIVFELSYIFDFIMVELFFRGWMLSENHHRIFLPGVFLYMLFHFWKPFPEALGSLGGGIILGLLARFTGNIWGGIILHCYVALLMEILVK